MVSDHIEENIEKHGKRKKKKKKSKTKELNTDSYIEQKIHTEGDMLIESMEGNHLVRKAKKRKIMKEPNKFLEYKTVKETEKVDSVVSESNGKSYHFVDINNTYTDCSIDNKYNSVKKRKKHKKDKKRNHATISDAKMLCRSDNYKVIASLTKVIKEEIKSIESDTVYGNGINDSVVTERKTVSQESYDLSDTRSVFITQVEPAKQKKKHKKHKKRKQSEIFDSETTNNIAKSKLSTKKTHKKHKKRKQSEISDSETTNKIVKSKLSTKKTHKNHKKRKQSEISDSETTNKIVKFKLSTTYSENKQEVSGTNIAQHGSGESTLSSTEGTNIEQHESDETTFSSKEGTNIEQHGSDESTFSLKEGTNIEQRGSDESTFSSKVGTNIKQHGSDESTFSTKDDTNVEQRGSDESTFSSIQDTNINECGNDECTFGSKEDVFQSTSPLNPDTDKEQSYSQMSPDQLADVIHETNNISAEENKKLSTKFKDYLTKGRFSKEEDDQIKKNWKTYFEMFPHQEPHIFIQTNLIRRRKDKHAVKEIINQTNFWVMIGKNILRTNFIIQKRCKLLFYPRHSQNKQYTAEDDRILMKSYAEHGNQWKLISELLGRSPESVSERYKRLKEATKKNSWSTEEDEALIAALKSGNGGAIPVKFNGLNWIQVAKSVPQRSAAQCMIRWLGTLSRPTINYGPVDKPVLCKYRVQAVDQIQIFEKISSQNIKLQRDIDWDIISSLFASKLSKRTLQKYWVQLKKTYVPDFKNKSLSEIISKIKKCLPMLKRKAQQQILKGNSSLSMDDTTKEMILKFEDSDTSSFSSDNES